MCIKGNGGVAQKITKVLITTNWAFREEMAEITTRRKDLFFVETFLSIQHLSHKKCFLLILQSELMYTTCKTMIAEILALLL